MKAMRAIAGTVLHDWPRFLACCSTSGGWGRMGNRDDRLSHAPDGIGVRCDWEYTRQLHLCDVFPSTGRWLMRQALRQWPLRLRECPASPQPSAAIPRPSAGPEPRTVDRPPQVSFLIGHRGLARLPHLLLTLQSIAGQEGVGLECIVVEQDSQPVIRDHLPGWIRYMHLPLPQPDLPYSRSWAFNVAARCATGELLILHDNDMLVPTDYAAEMWRLYCQGFEVMQLKRFIFYLTAAATERAFAVGQIPDSALSEHVVENLEGGGSVGICRDAYHKIGGMDEDFIGWGGEDNEFWDRCLTRHVWEYAYLPLIHLWHAAQPGKRARNGRGALTADLTAERRALDPHDRIADLCGREWGRVDRLGGTRR